MKVSREQMAKMATQLATMDAISKGLEGQVLLDYIKSDTFDKAALKYMEMFQDETIWGNNE
jgi:hypothetical protein